MQHVKLTWLRAFNYGLVGATIVMYLGYFYLKNPNLSEATKSHWAISTTALVIGAIHAAAVIFFERTLFKRFAWAITFGSAVTYAFLFAAIIESSGNTNVIYRLLYIVFAFFIAVNGAEPPLILVIFTWLILVFTVLGILTPTHASLSFNIVVDSLLSISALSGWLFFKKYYPPKDDAQARALKSLLAEEQFKSNVLLESITDGVMIINTQGTVQVLNKSALTLLGWTAKDALNLDYRSLISPETEGSEEHPQEDAITKSLKSGTSAQKVSLLTTHSNRHRYVDIVASPIYQPKPQGSEEETEPQIVGVIAVLRDVDAQKRQEQQRSDFISTASHEMRTPVASIQGFIELSLNPKVATIDEKARGYLLKAQSETKHLGQLFQDLLTVSRSEDGRLTNHPKVIEVGTFLQELIEDDRVMAEKKGLKVILDTDQTREKTVAPLLYINADPDRLREVVSNLFDNAVKYTKSGVITIGASLKDQGVVIRVADTGVGIAEEDIPHLFQKFYRTDNSATREVGGTGLGLYICKEIVSMMGGKIYVQSTLGAGSTFFVELPRVSADTVSQVAAPKA